MPDHIQIHPENGTITWSMTPETVEFLIMELPANDGVTLSLRAKQTELQEAMHGQADKPCRGTGMVGECDGNLLKCPVCDRVIGLCPPNTLPAHEPPVFQNGCPI